MGREVMGQIVQGLWAVGWTWTFTLSEVGAPGGL